MPELQAKPKEYRIYNRGEYWPFVVKARWFNDRWVNMCSFDTKEQAQEYINSELPNNANV